MSCSIAQYLDKVWLLLDLIERTWPNFPSCKLIAQAVSQRSSISILLQFMRDISGTKESSDGVEEPRSSRGPDGLRAMGMRNF